MYIQIHVIILPLRPPRTKIYTYVSPILNFCSNHEISCLIYSIFALSLQHIFLYSYSYSKEAKWNLYPVLKMVETYHKGVIPLFHIKCIYIEYKCILQFADWNILFAFFLLENISYFSCSLFCVCTEFSHLSTWRGFYFASWHQFYAMNKFIVVYKMQLNTYVTICNKMHMFLSIIFNSFNNISTVRNIFCI